MNKKCSKCGFENSEGSEFCQECGTQLTLKTESKSHSFNEGIEKIEDVVFRPKKKGFIKTFLKVLVILIICVFSLIVLAMFISPNENGQSEPTEPQQEQDFVQAATCKELGEKIYKEDQKTWDLPGISEPSSPIIYYNKRLNRCLYAIAISFAKLENTPNAPYTITVKDGLTNKVIIEFSTNAFENVESKEVKERRAEFDRQYNELFSE